MTQRRDQITARAVPDAERSALVERLFGLHFPMRLEPTIFYIAGSLARAYTGGYWNFHAISNSGFFMSPEVGAALEVACPNGYAGKLAQEAFGITACMYTYSELSFGRGAFAEICADHYHRPREFALHHEGAQEILAACD